MEKIYYLYWGKADCDRDRFHLLPYHCLDVAAVGYVLLTENHFLKAKILSRTGMEEAVFLRWILILLALHDVGKFSEGFQNLRPDLLALLQNITSSKAYSVRHDSLGFVLWRERLWPDCAFLFPEIKDPEDWQDVFEILMRVFAGHHGQPPSMQGPNGSWIHADAHFSDHDAQAARTFCADLHDIFPPVAPCGHGPDVYDAEDAMTPLSWLLAGLTVFCDWVGSNADWFPFVSNPMPLDEYWRLHALPRARQALATLNVGLAKEPARNQTFTHLYPAFSCLTPLQQHAATCQIRQEPQLFILEDMTGSGKTEAAMILAARLMEAGQGQGIFFALPTMATSNAMFERMAAMYQRLFEETQRPFLMLSHGARHLSETFARMRINPDEDGGPACSEWLVDNKKKSLLADVGVGTLDQALLAILPARFQSLRLFGLARHVLIVDEVHAYDPYMNMLLQTVLRFHAALGGSAILLSATLPMKTKQALVGAFAKGMEKDVTQPESRHYPLCTSFNATDELVETCIQTNPAKHRAVQIVLMDKTDDVFSLIRQKSEQGCCVCWIRNTVHDATQAYSELRKHISEENLLLFHARFAMGDRLKQEEQVVRIFGKRSGAEERRGKVLIATQVVEQSLDLDFDVLITDLSPMDLLIQRAGRLHRHVRDAQGNPQQGNTDGRTAPCLVIHGPLPHKNAPGDWYASFFPKAAFVYPHHGYLWRTASLLAERGAVAMPADARLLIETAFSEDPGDISSALQQRDLKAEAQSRADTSLAHINMLKLDEGYAATMNQWREDMKTPTRLGEMHSTVRLARWEGGKLTPWHTDGPFAWDMSQVSLRFSQVAAEAHDPLLRQAVAEAKDAMPDKGKWSILVPLEKSPDGRWHGKARNNREQIVIVEYDPANGVMIKEE